MPERSLKRYRILLVEDEYILAEHLRSELEAAGALVLGPVADVQRALALVAAERDIDVAVLDVNLGGEKVFPVADALAARGVPFVFTTGYDAIVPETYAQVARCEKPIRVQEVVRAIRRQRAR